MNASDLDQMVLKRKRDKVIRTICLTCEYCHLTIPEINFDGCSLEGANGPELAHYHIGGNKICISERQLKLQDFDSLENTSIHEVMHHLGLMHGSNAERSKFEQIKNYVRSRVWKPPDGVSFISGDTVNESSKKIREDPERLAQVNEDSDYVKAMREYDRRHAMPKANITEISKNNATISHKIEVKNKQDSETNVKIRKVNPKMQKINVNKIKQEVEQESKSSRYKPMTDEEKERSRKKLGISIKDRPDVSISQPEKSINVEDKYFDVSHSSASRPHEEGECTAAGCVNDAMITCQYCTKKFCKHHSSARIATTPNEILRIETEDNEKYLKYSEDSYKKDGHPCAGYTIWWNEEGRYSKNANQPSTKPFKMIKGNLLIDYPSEEDKTKKESKSKPKEESPESEKEEKPKKNLTFLERIKDYLGIE